jgi:hypothetical protein
VREVARASGVEFDEDSAISYSGAPRASTVLRDDVADAVVVSMERGVGENQTEAGDLPPRHLTVRVWSSSDT